MDTITFIFKIISAIILPVIFIFYLVYFIKFFISGKRIIDAEKHPPHSKPWFMYVVKFYHYLFTAYLILFLIMAIYNKTAK